MIREFTWSEAWFLVQAVRWTVLLAILAPIPQAQAPSVTPDGEVHMLRQLDGQTADICFIAEKGLLLVPHLGSIAPRLTSSRN